MSYSNFNTFKLFQNIGINSSNNYVLSMKPNDNNVSFHSSNSIDYNNVDIMSIKNIINKKQNEDLNLSSLTGTTINPVITINNNHSDCRIMTNLNVAGNLNITKNLDVSGNLNINSTGYINLPIGTTSERPSNPNLGTLRYNSQTHNFEGYSNGAWINLTGGSSSSGLYDFTSQTFGNYGVLGRNGPSLAQAKSGLDGAPTWKDDTTYFNVVNGIQYWTVPKNGNYTITAYGADAVKRGGRGAIITGTFSLLKNEIIRILVGQRPEPYDHGNGGGAGGTFVVRSPFDTEVSILVIAGGGGGGHVNSASANDWDDAPRTDTNIHGQGVVPSAYSGGSGTGTGGSITNPNYNLAGGSNGQGGTGGYEGNVGGGFHGPLSTSNGIAHGFIDSTYPGEGGETGGNEGGFGGGARHGNTHGGGGGGFSGGGGSSSDPYQGGGGSSYNSGSNKSQQVGINVGWVGQGKVVISFIS